VCVCVCSPLIDALKHYTAQGLAIFVLPWVLGIRGLIHFPHIPTEISGCPTKIIDKQRLNTQCWRQSKHFISCIESASEVYLQEECSKAAVLLVLLVRMTRTWRMVMTWCLRGVRVCEDWIVMTIQARRRPWYSKNGFGRRGIFLVSWSSVGGVQCSVLLRTQHLVGGFLLFEPSRLIGKTEKGSFSLTGWKTRHVC
jgi:hypothetical protein